MPLSCEARSLYHRLIAQANSDFEAFANGDIIAGLKRSGLVSTTSVESSRNEFIEDYVRKQIITMQSQPEMEGLCLEIEGILP